MFSWLLVRDENLFSSNRSNGASKNSFHSGFKNVYSIIVKSSPKKVVAKKLFCQFKICQKSQKIRFWGKILFGCTFYEGQMYIFEISMRRQIYLYPNRFIKIKIFSSYSRVNVLLMN